MARRAAKARQDRKAARRIEMGEDYVSSGDEAVPAKVDHDEVPEGDVTDPTTMAAKFAEYQKKLK